VKTPTLTEEDIESWIQNVGIVRIGLKTISIIKNTKSYLGIEASCLLFCDYIWLFVDSKTIMNKWQTKDDVSTSTAQSDNMTEYLIVQEY
jgi:DNA-3-methyladenine glycosylase I